MKLQTAFLATAIALSLAACKPNEEQHPERTNAPAATQHSGSQTGAANNQTGTNTTQTTSPNTTQGVTSPVTTGAGNSSTVGAAGAGSATAAQNASSAPANTGTRECDEVIDAVKKCINSNVPAEQREVQMRQFSEMAAQWQNVPEASRAATCETAKESVRETYSNFGCNF